MGCSQPAFTLIFSVFRNCSVDFRYDTEKRPRLTRWLVCPRRGLSRQSISYCNPAFRLLSTAPVGSFRSISLHCLNTWNAFASEISWWDQAYLIWNSSDATGTLVFT